MGKFSKQLCHCEERLWTLLGNFITELLDQRNDDWCASICENITFHGLETTQQQQQQQQLYLYTTLVKYLLLLSKFLTQKFYFCKEGVFLRLKPEQSVSAELLIMLFKVVPHDTTFDETMVCNHSVESYWVVLSCYCQLFVHHFLKTSHGCLFSLRGSSCVLPYGTVNCCTLGSWLWKGYWNPCVYDSTIHIHVNCMDTFHRLRHRVVRQAYFFAHTAEKNAWLAFLCYSVL